MRITSFCPMSEYYIEALSKVLINGNLESIDQGLLFSLYPVHPSLILSILSFLCFPVLFLRDLRVLRG